LTVEASNGIKAPPVVPPKTWRIKEIEIGRVTRVRAAHDCPDKKAKRYALRIRATK
jgi:hypothetical protein